MRRVKNDLPSALDLLWRLIRAGTVGSYCVAGVLLVVCNGILAWLAWCFPGDAPVWRVLALFVLVAAVGFVLLHLAHEIRYVLKDAPYELAGAAGMEEPGMAVGFMGTVDGARRVARYVLVLLFSWLCFSLFVAVIAMPECTDGSSVRAERHEFSNLELKDKTGATGFDRFAWTVASSGYFVATSIATIGYGDIAPGIDAFWGRTAGVAMALYVLLVLPLLGIILAGHSSYATLVALATPRGPVVIDEGLGAVNKQRFSQTPVAG